MHVVWCMYVTLSLQVSSQCASKILVTQSTDLQWQVKSYLHVELKISAKEQDGQLGSAQLPILCSIDLSFCSICVEEVLVSFLV